MSTYTNYKQWDNFKSDNLSTTIFTKWYIAIKSNHYKHEKHAFNSLCKHNNGFKISTITIADKSYYTFRPNIKEDKKPKTYVFDDDYTLIGVMTYDRKCIYKTNSFTTECKKKIL